MEKEPKKPETENNDDSDDDTDANFPKKSKESKKSESEENDSDEKKESQKKASFFAEGKKPEESETETEEESTTGESELVETELEEENLTEAEVTEVVLSIVDARLQEVSEELEGVEENSPEEFSVLANAIFLESLKEQANSDTDFTSENIDSAFDETIEDIEIEVPEEVPAVPTEFETEILNPEDVEIETPDTITSPLPALPILSEATFGPKESATRATAPESAPDEYEAYIPKSDMLLGLVLGYIIGRRGGRKRTEKKLQPKIDNLENEVAELYNAIYIKEKEIRKVAAELAETKVINLDVAKQITERRKVRTEVKQSLKRREELSKDPGVEKIGKFSLPALKVFHERRLPDGSENSPKRVQVEVMTTPELLEKIAYLKIDNMSVKVMFEQNRLTVDSLRQITKEYLRGGNFEKTFYQDLLPDPAEIETHRSKIYEQHKSTPKPLSGNIHEIKNADNDQIKNVVKNQNGLIGPSEKQSKPPLTRPLIAVIVAVTLLAVFALAILL